MDYIALKAEIQTDPTALGYAAPFAAGRDAEVAGILNLSRANIQITRDYVSGADILGAIQSADYLALTQLQAIQLNGIIGATGLVKTNSTQVRATLAALFSGKTTTLNALQALQTRNGSRVEQLFGAGTAVTADDVSIARRS